MRVLVTGVGGFLGRNLAESLRQHYEVSAPTRAELDLLDDDAVRRYLSRNPFDAVVHSATVRANRRIGAPAELLDHNCRMFFNLVRHPDAFGKLLFLSSGAVYDRRSPVARISETDFDRSVPVDAYGFSKYICAQHISGSSNLFDLRLFGVFGPHEDWEIRFPSNACCRAVWDMPVVMKQNVRFDYLDVSDLSKITRWFIENQPRHQSYNVCSGQAVELTALARKVIRASGKNLSILAQQSGSGEEYSGDNRRLLEEMPGFQFRSLDDSIDALYRWYQDHKNTIDPARLRFDEAAELATAGCK